MHDLNHALNKDSKMDIKFTDLNLPEGLVEASRGIMEKKEPIIINPEMHNMDTVQRLQMGEETDKKKDDEDDKDEKPEKDTAKEIQKKLKDKKHEIFEKK
jgi:hypothetical protein